MSNLPPRRLLESPSDDTYYHGFGRAWPKGGKSAWTELPAIFTLGSTLRGYGYPMFPQLLS